LTNTLIQHAYTGAEDVNPADSQARRRFLKLAAAGAVAAPIAATLLPRFARAQDLPHLAESDPTAMALGYKEDAPRSTKRNSRPTRPARCAATASSGQQAGDAYGPWRAVPRQGTNAKGWCSGYNAK